ncbi:hypothetical protein Acidovoranil_22820 [Acidovorax sp. FG27]
MWGPVQGGGALEQHASAHAQPAWAARALQSIPMFAARPFALNTTAAALAAVTVRAITTKTTTITG